MRSKSRVQRQKEIRQFLKDVKPIPLRVIHNHQIKQFGEKLSERTTESDLAEMRELGIIGYNKEEKLYSYDDPRMQENFRSVLDTNVNDIIQASSALFRIAKSLDPNTAKMSDRRYSEHLQDQLLKVWQTPAEKLPKRRMRKQI